MVKLTNISAKENNDNVSANFAFSLINSVDNPKINTIKTPIRIPLAIKEVFQLYFHIFYVYFSDRFYTLQALTLFRY